MTDHQADPTADVLDALVTQLLACGGPLSQIIAHMHAFDASGLSAPDAPPILEIAHSVIRGEVGVLAERYSDDELRVSAEIVEQFTTLVCENVFFVSPSEIRRSLGGSGSPGSRRRGPGRSARRRH